MMANFACFGTTAIYPYKHAREIRGHGFGTCTLSLSTIYVISIQEIKTMNILLLCDHFPPAFAPRMGYLCKYLRTSGHEVDVVFEQLPGDKRSAYLCGYASSEHGLCFYKENNTGWKIKLQWITVMLRDVLWHYKDIQVCKTVSHWINQSGKTYVALKGEKELDLHSSDVLGGFSNKGIGWDLHIQLPILLECIKKKSNEPYWDMIPAWRANQDLRNPKFKKELKQVKKQMGII